MRRTKAGGSVASDAVVANVSQKAFDNMTSNFSNYTDSASCKGQSAGCACTAVRACKLHAKSRGCGRSAEHSKRCKRGGDIFTNVSGTVANAVRGALKGPTTGGFNVFRSSPAPAGFEYANLRGSNAARSGGSGLKNMSEYMSNSNTYTVRNRRGGAAATESSADSNFGTLEYKIGSASPSTSFDRSTPLAVDRFLSDASPSSMPAMNKSTSFGGVNDSSHFFNYGGVKEIAGGKWGRKPAPRKKAPAAKKPAAKKPAAKKPAAKKPAAKKH